MDTERLREFVEFSRTLNFTAAARELHMSQPALSKHVQELENEMGVTLVRRGGTGEGNTLTPTGALFVERVGQLLVHAEAIVRDCQELNAQMPPVRIQGAQHGFTVVSQLRSRMEEGGAAPVTYRYVKTDLPIRDALDLDVIDFAIHLEATPEMREYADSALRERYGWLPLRPEPLRLLVGEGNPLFDEGEVGCRDLENYEVLYGSSPSYGSWSRAVAEAFLMHGCHLNLVGVPDAPLEGGAFPLGSQRMSVCTDRFAHYYRDLDAEESAVVRVREFEPVFYPFLVYRRASEAPGVRAIVRTFEAAGIADGSMTQETGA